MIMAGMPLMAIAPQEISPRGKIRLEKRQLDENDDDDNVKSRLTSCRPSQLRERVLPQKCKRANAHVVARCGRCD